MPTEIEATYRVVTPMFCGGAGAGSAELRMPSFKGVLRFWWRALARPRTAGRAYAQTVRLGRLAGVKTRADETPAEYISRLSAAWPRATWALYGVVQWYDHVLYGPDKDAPPDRPFSWRSIVFGLLALALLRFVPQGRSRVRRRTADAG